MAEPSPLPPPSPETLGCIGFDQKTRSVIREQLKSQAHGVEFMDKGGGAYDLIFLNGSSQVSSECIPFINRLKKEKPSAIILLYGHGMGVEALSHLLSRVEIFSVLEDLSHLPSVYKEAIKLHKEKNTYYQSLRKVKRHNKTLEVLRENLEHLVHERTRKEFEASQQVEIALKEIQSIVGFIKRVTRLESIEDLLQEIRQEFKKIHGLMPPLLLIEDKTGLLRYFYFQGKQLIEKTLISPGKGEFTGLEESTMRRELSHLLGRPVSSLSLCPIQFRSKDFNGLSVLLVFEHSMNSSQLGRYESFSKQRWPIVNMALESLLIKGVLRTAASQWARTFDAMKDPIIIMDSGYQISIANASFRRQESLGLWSDQSSLFKEGSIKKTFSTGLPQTSDVRLGETIYRVHSYPISIEGYGAVSHVISQLVDVTQSIDLQSRMIQGEKMAAVGLLAGNIAHELNNPLTGIHSLTELLLLDLDQETSLYQDLQEVSKAAFRCQRIIKDLLEFSDLGEKGQVQEINVNHLIEKTLPLLKTVMRTLNSHIDLLDQEIRVRINPQLLQQVLFNLINNACQAMDEGGVLSVSSALRGDHVEIRVRDTGSGIPEEIKELIFDPFFTTKSEGQGTGLGLSMSKKVVEGFGGELILNRELEEGTEFMIRLPVVQPTEGVL